MYTTEYTITLFLSQELTSQDEFDKRTEFFDEFHEDGDAENDGEFHHERKMSKGGDYKAGHHDADDHEQMFGKKSEYEKSDHHRDDKGHEVKNGEDSHHEQGNMYGEKKSHRGGKEWTHKEGNGADDKKKHWDSTFFSFSFFFSLTNLCTVNSLILFEQ